MKSRFSISVIIPIYNEEVLLERSLPQIISFLREHFDNFQVVMVESGSTDRSGEICDRLASEYEEVETIHQEMREGFGSGLKCGFSYAIKDLVWPFVIDIPYSLDVLTKALPLLDEHDYVLSYRQNDPRSFFRRFQSVVYNWMVKILFALPAKHVNSAFKLYKRSAIKDLTILSDGWFIDAEMLYRLKRRKASFTEIPVELVDREDGTSSIGPLTFLPILCEMMILAIRTRGRN